MNYEFTKLSEVTEVSAAENPKLIIEDNGEIVRIAASEVVGGNSSGGIPTQVINYTAMSGGRFTSAGGTRLDPGEIYNLYVAGNRIIILNDYGSRSEIMSVYYRESTYSTYVGLVLADNINYNETSSTLAKVEFATYISPNPVSATSVVSDDVIIYQCSSAGSESGSGHGISKADINAYINSNKRIMVYYDEWSISTASTDYKTALCSVVGSYIDSNGATCLILSYPGGAYLRTITISA